MKLNEILNGRPELIVMVGLPGSGKDYWLEQYIKANPDKKYFVASTDAAIEAAAAAQGKTYSDVHADEMKNATRAMNDGVSDAIRRNANVIWNQTNMAPKKRAGILSRFPKHYIKKAVVVTADEAVHQQRLDDRAAKTGKYISPAVMKDMRDRYIEPSKDEGFDEIIHVDNS